MKNNLSPDLQNSIKVLAKNLTPILDELHAMPPSSKNYYANYLAILTAHKPERAKLIAIAMLYAGANKDGIQDALKLI